MMALPLPERGGSIQQLRELVNLSDDGFVLYVSWILDALCPGRPHPVLFLSGSEGSAKSMATEFARSLTDPNTADLRNLPTTIRDLYVAANNARVLAFDNIGGTITTTISDALCQLSTGSGYGKRKLYSDVGEVLIRGHRPIVLNGLANAISRSDLADRSVILPMARIADDDRESHAAMKERFGACRGQIFGALLNCVSGGLRQLPRVRLERLPRMSDYVLWGVACEPFPPAIFLAAFERSAAEANENVAEADPVATAIAAFMADRDSPWTGTAAALLTELSTRDKSEAAPSQSKTWPREAAIFGRRLRAVTTVLHKLGVDVQIGKASNRKRTRTVTLRRIEPAPMRQQKPKDGSDGSDGSNTGGRAFQRVLQIYQAKL